MQVKAALAISEPANQSNLEVAAPLVAKMDIDELHEWVDLNDLVNSLPPQVKDDFYRHCRAKTARIIAGDDQLMLSLLGGS